MPRTGWLALGAVTCGLVFGSVPSLGLDMASATVVVALVAMLGLARAGRIVPAALALGVATVALRLAAGGITAEPVPPPPTTALDGPWAARVLTLGSTSGGQQRAMLEVRLLGTGGREGPAGDGATADGAWRVYAWLPRYPPIVPGDRIEFDEPLEPVRHDGSEFAGYLEGVGVAATVRVRDLTVVGEGEGILGIAESIRRVADESLARVVPEPMAGLASAILVGRRDRVAREVADAFTATGLSHVVAISGWNIALIGAVIGGLLAALGLGRRQRTVAIVVVLALFTLVAGGGASVVRAALMGGVALVARETGRPGTAAAALGIAVWLLLLLDPAMATDIGFQLSVAATAGLLAWGSRLTSRLLGTQAGLPRRWLAESLGVSLAAQAATLPLVLFHFGRLSLVSPVANLAMAPIVAPAMLVGSLCLVAGMVVGAGVPAVLAAPFAFLGWVVLGAMVWVAGLFASVPYASVELPPIAATLGAAGVALAVAVVAWRARATGHATAAPAPKPVPPSAPPGRPPSAPPGRPAERGRPGRRRLIVATVSGGLVVIVGMSVLLRVVQRESRLVVTALDVGQGDAILVEGQRGARLLLDGGPDPDRLLTVLDRHVPPWDRRIDLVILTHPHEDHVAGLAMLLARYRVSGVAENGMLGAGPGDVAFRERLAAMGLRTSRLAAGDSLSLDGVRAMVRWPIRDEVPERSPSEGRKVNDTSVVLDLRFGERRLLLTGDIEDDVDPRLLASGIGEGRRLDLLKVAHHGSRTATSDAWLDALEPRVAMVSAGTGNPYGHPAPRTIERLEAHGARVLRTDLDGDLQVSTDGHDLRVATSGGRPVAAARTASADRVRTALARPPTIAQGVFLCAIPLAPARLAALGEAPPPRPAQGRQADARQRPADPTTPIRGDPAAPCYDRVDVDAHPTRGGRPVARRAARGRHPRALDGDRGRGVLPGGRGGSRGPPGRPWPGRDSGAVA